MAQGGVYDYTVSQYVVDFSGEATWTSLLNYILEAAGDDADRNGFGVTDLNAGNCSWVLRRMAAEITRRLHRSEEFSVRTWVSEVNRTGTVRNMTVTGSDGCVVAQAVTQWAVIDVERRVALDLRGRVDCSYAIVDEPSPIAMPARVGIVEPTRIREYEVVYSDTDFNNHVNAIRYMVWMVDTLPMEYVAGRQLRRIDVNFLHEAVHGQRLSIGFEAGEKSLFAIDDENGTTLCRAALEWK